MLDPNLIREKPDFVKEGIAKKGTDPFIIDDFIKVDNERKDLVKSIDELRHLRNELSEKIGKMISSGEEVENVK
ncbi:MAG: serine--tRNA ligase, partial [Caldiserica bacterium]|nr:serine--tRNA ligase [Caldisericota bacterium]